MKKADKEQYCEKSIPSQGFKNDCVGIEKDHFHVKEYKQDCDQKIFYRHRLAGITMTFDPAGKSFQFIGRFLLGPSQCVTPIITATKIKANNN